MCLVFLLVRLLWTSLVAGPVFGTEKSEVASIANAINERSILAKDIAGYKYRSNKALASPALRQSEIDRIVATAVREGLDEDSVTPFVEAMLDMDLDIQKGYVDEWSKKASPTPKPRDYEEVRLGIKKKDAKIMKLIHERLKNDMFRESDRPEMNRILTAPYTTESNKKVLVDTLFQIKLKTCH